MKIIIFYFIITSAIFIYLAKNVPPLIHDQLLYFNLADRLINNHFNIFVTNFENRGFAYPVFLALVKFFSNPFLQGGNLLIFYFANLLLFHISNFVIFKSLKMISENFALAFLAISSFNIINLSFTTTILSETLSFFIISLIFYLFFNKKKNLIYFFGLGFLSSLLVFTRLNALVPLILISVYIGFLQLAQRRYLNIIIFSLGCLIVLLVSVVNVYMTTNRIAIFSEDTLRSGNTKYPSGIIYFRQEGSMDKRFESPEILYINVENFKIDRACSGLINCQLHYLRQDPKAYFSMISAHLFAIFDRTYLDLYIKDIFAVNNLLRFANYFVLSGVILYVMFFRKSEYQKVFSQTAAIFILINILPYLPTLVEPRYSAPLYPIILVLFSIYIISFSELKNYQKIKYLAAQLTMVLFFFLISNQIAGTLYIG